MSIMIRIAQKGAFRRIVEGKIAHLKDMPIGSTVIRGRIGDTPFALEFLTREYAGDNAIIHCMSRWRKTHEKWFPSRFPVSDARTIHWFNTCLMYDSDRLLFFIRARNDWIGHIGLNRFNYAKKTCEIDNIVRGRAGVQGLMEAAIIVMTDWARKTFGLSGFTLRTTSDNLKALALYHRLGFVETKRTPLVYNKTKDGGEWEEAHNKIQKAERYEVRMKRQ